MDLSFRHENLLNSACRARCVTTVNAVMTDWQPTFPSFWHYLGAVLRVPVLGGDPSQSMYSVLSTWGQFPHPLLPSTAGNLWLEFMRAYQRKRRPLTYNPTSLIGKDPYIVAMRLEHGEF